MRRPECGHENRPDAAFCDECGNRLPAAVRCDRCGRLSPGGQRFCDGCGAALSRQFVLPVRAPTQPEMFAGGRYRVERFLGEGAHKRVYLAHDVTLDRGVAFALIGGEALDAGRATGSAERGWRWAGLPGIRMW